MKTYAIVGWVLLIIVAGYAMLRVGMEVEGLEDRLSDLNRQAMQEQEATHVLRAEWSYLNRPERLSELSRELLPNLQPPDVDRITTMEQLPEREANIVLPAAAALGKSR